MCKSHCPSRKSILLPPHKTSFFNGAAAIGQNSYPGRTRGKLYLDESNVRGLLSEALTADVQAILADQTSLVGANTATSQQSAPAPYLPIHTSPYPSRGIAKVNVPGASSLAVGSWARVPDGFVRHVGSTWYCICSWKLGCVFAMKWRRVTDRAECEVVEVSRWILLDWLDS